MIKKLLCFVTMFLCAAAGFSQYSTPNTGVTWETEELIANAPPGVITFNNGIFTISQNITISAADQLTIAQEALIHIDPNVQIIVEGSLVADANSITITATNPAAPYDSIRFEAGSSGYFNNVTINYGKGIRVSTSDFEMHNSSMSYHVGGTTTSAALTFSTGSPLIADSEFKYNVVPAFGSGANQEVSPTFIGNYLEGNNSSNTNRPQINMGPSGNDTIRIVNNIIKGNPALTLVGGISASSLLGNNNRVIIDGNTIFDNRYGITVMGANSGGYIRNNIIEDNDTQNNPAQGGSGISLSASGAATMNIIASGNQIRRNLWGITLISMARIDLGTTDPEDNSPGGNIFSENGNGGQTYALYNNTPNPVNAANNCWIEGMEPTAGEVENVISHQPDDASLGLVAYTPFSCSLGTGNYAVLKPVVYPNPMRGSFSLKMPTDGTARIYSLDGQLLFSKVLQTGENAISLPLAAGMYLLQTETPDAVFTTKIVNR
ncbi:MAG TPA: T9SS type A sorting domain-containing protein [Flavobacterium sp.]|jgi:parallel beta-helix repeat protein